MNKKFIISWGAFVWIYQRGTEDKPWVQQGLRFGIAIALVAAFLNRSDAKG